ncbi:glycosyltransferase family 9 protein [Ekhidna sp.]|uniref:glycosyltransferase family 9 protein n=1 Tax=Ekhidna sp. TaxID=2608089 RepID=UPI003B510F01
MKILLIQSDSLVHSLMITPIIRSLKTELDSEIHLLTYSRRELLFKENPYIDKILSFEESDGLKKELKKNHFDYVLDYQNSLKTKIFRYGIGKETFAFKNEKIKQWLYCKTKINLLSKKHLVDQYFELLDPLNIKSDNLGYDFKIPDKDEVEREWLPDTHQSEFALVAINADFFTRKLPANRLIELCDRINKPIVLLGNECDLDVANEIEEFFKRGTQAEEEEIEGLNKNAIIFNACGKFNFNQSASLIKQASWVFTHDNEWMHIAAALKKKVYTIWGNTTPLFGQYPYKNQFTVFENNKINCRPCSPNGYSNCPKGHFKCMNDVTFDFYLAES